MTVRVDLPLDRIFLDLENPRHTVFKTNAEVIEYLCAEEEILPLARDIVKIGLNPIELIAVVPDNGETGCDATYIVAEGNRRICALKLLEDPDLAPAKFRAAFTKLAGSWAGVGLLPCVVFDNFTAVKDWLQRIHDGQQGGIGRRKWSSDQSARHSGNKRDRIALRMLDYAQEAGLITPEQRKRRLTTASRYLNKASIQRAMGIDATDPAVVKLTRSVPDTLGLLVKFIADMESGHVNSRAVGEEVFEAYARELDQLPKSAAPSEPIPLKQSARVRSAPRLRLDVKPAAYLAQNPAVIRALKPLDSQKLNRLYHSITSIPLNPHAPLIAIGLWAFIETLASRAGKGENTSFEAFFSANRRASYGLPTGKARKAVDEALGRVSASGDVTKHDGHAALFNGDQLFNDLETLSDLIVGCCNEIAAQAQ